MVLIKNKKQLHNAKTNDALEILEAGLDAAKPENFLDKFIDKEKLRVRGKSYFLSRYDKIYLIAVGKAADSMSKFVESKLRIDSGVVVIPQNYKPSFSRKNIKFIRAGHPIPNKASIAASEYVIKLLHKTKKDDLAVFLVSGGASSLLCLPDGITLRQKQQVTEELLRCGASINEINTIRKHLSQIKGGRLLEHLNCAAVSLVLSDVVGDDLSSIASGTMYCDKTTYSDCFGILKKYNLEERVPHQALKQLGCGVKGEIAETPKKPKIPNVIVARNRDCLAAMAKTAENLEYKSKILAPFVGDANSAIKLILKNHHIRKKSCLIFGGETTVRVRGRGKGGRNQELVLRILTRLRQDAVVASIGTDGIDGNTADAGAISYLPIRKREAEKYLQNNDSNSFFRKYGGLIKTGPTHTNLLDIGLILQS